MPERSFGRTIRFRRTKIGLSQAKLGELVGRSATTIRAWERDTSTPTDPDVIDALAAVLAIDSRILYEKVGLDTPDAETSPTVEQALASLHPDREMALDDDPEEDEESRRPYTAQLFDLPDEPPEPTPLPAFTQTPTPAYAAPKGSLLITAPTPPVVEPSYIEDTAQRQLYRVRNLATAVLIVGLVIVLLWSASNALDAIGEWWDSFFGQLKL